MLARLVLLPPHDPQFRRNRERVVRDAERENLILDWDLGLPEEERRLLRARPAVANLRQVVDASATSRLSNRSGHADSPATSAT